MAQTQKQWNNGDLLSVTYEGNGDGTAVFTSEANEGIDREMTVAFVGAGMVAERTVKQKGLRVRFITADNLVFSGADKVFGVLRSAEEPENPMTDYELIDYVTFDGSKVFDTGVYGNNKTTIEVKFQRAETAISQYLFGCSSGNRLTAYLSPSGYWRYGNAYPNFNTAVTDVLTATVTPNATTIGNTKKTFTAAAFTTDFTIPLGGHKPSSGIATAEYIGYVFYFKMAIGGEVVVDWIPVRRKSDGVEGFWDNLTNTFVLPI